MQSNTLATKPRGFQKISGLVSKNPFFKITKDGIELAVLRVTSIEEKLPYTFFAKGLLARQIQKYLKPKDKVTIIPSPQEETFVQYIELL